MGNSVLYVQIVGKDAHGKRTSDDSPLHSKPCFQEHWDAKIQTCMNMLRTVSQGHNFFSRGRTSSVGRALDCRAGGRGFDSRSQTNTQGLKITEK